MTENIGQREFIKSFDTANKNQVCVYTLSEGDFQLVWEFYQVEREKLQNKADFYPYKQSEIKSILAGEGVFIGGFIDDRLIALCAIDYDATYQDGIKKANENFPAFPFSCDLLEFSGLFVASDKRKLGIAENMTEILLEIARVKKPNSRLFAVVLESNFPSMKNFFSHGFKLFGWWQMNSEYKFVYLISPKQNEELEKTEKEKIEVQNIVEKLEQGYSFFGVEEGKLVGNVCKKL